MKKIIYILFIQLLVMAQLQAQNRVVTGVVTDSAGPVVGASIVEKGLPSNGTVTTADGRFTITLKGKSNTLVVTGVGYEEQQVNVANRSDVRVTLTQDAGGLEDVVIVGYAKQKKVTSTGSVSSVAGKELRDNPSASLQNTLAGRLPGFFSVQPSGRPGADGAQFFVRGISTYNGSTAPLIIVDDIEFSYDQFARLDPNEIESLSILKDASTTAVYGVKGANGVVIITTRRGKIGAPKFLPVLKRVCSSQQKFPVTLMHTNRHCCITRRRSTITRSILLPDLHPAFRKPILIITKTEQILTVIRMLIGTALCSNSSANNTGPTSISVVVQNV